MAATHRAPRSYRPRLNARVGVEHRSRPIGLTDRSPLASDHEGVLRAGAPSACAYHRVWFDPATIEDHRVHEFGRPS